MKVSDSTRRIALLLLLGAGLGLPGSLEPPARPRAQLRALSPVKSGSAEERIPTQWKRRAVTVTLDPSLSRLGSEAIPAIRNAAAVWTDSGADLPYLHYAQGNVTHSPSLVPDGENTILVGPIPFEGHEEDLAVTVGFSSQNDGEISEADIIINERYSFSEISSELPGLARAQREGGYPIGQSCDGTLDPQTCSAVYDLENLLTHEFGHFFGLGEDYEDASATMFSCTSACETHKRDLEGIDAQRIFELYSGEPQAETAASCSAAPLGAGRSPGRPLWILGLDCVLSVLAFRRRGTG